MCLYITFFFLSALSRPKYPSDISVNIQYSCKWRSSNKKIFCWSTCGSYEEPQSCRLSYQVWFNFLKVFFLSSSSVSLLHAIWILNQTLGKKSQDAFWILLVDYNYNCYFWTWRVAGLLVSHRSVTQNLFFPLPLNEYWISCSVTFCLDSVGSQTRWVANMPFTVLYNLEVEEIIILQGEGCQSGSVRAWLVVLQILLADLKNCWFSI